MLQTEIIQSEDVKKYLGLLNNSEIMGMENDRYTCFGAFDDENDESMGVLVAEILEECLRIERIYVVPEHRRKGVAKTLLNIVTDLPEELKETVVAYGVEEELNREFLTAMNFHEKVNEYTYLEGSLINYQKLPLPAKGSEYTVLPIEKVAENAMKNFMLKTKRENDSKMSDLFIENNELSDGSVVCMKNNQIAAVIILEETDENIMFPLIYGKDNKAIFYCFSVIREELIEEYGLNASIRFLLNKGKGREALEKIVYDTVEKNILFYELEK